MMATIKPIQLTYFQEGLTIKTWILFCGSEMGESSLKEENLLLNLKPEWRLALITLVKQDVLPPT